MGYTHYYQILKDDAFSSIWPTLVSDIPHIIEAAGVPVRCRSDVAEIPLINVEQGICFNGIESNGHEPLRLSNHDLRWTFCKTARKPYDLTVCLVLLRAKQLAGSAFGLSSDGLWDDPHDGWQRALSVYKQLWPADVVECPFTVEDEDEGDGT